MNEEEMTHRINWMKMQIEEIQDELQLHRDRSLQVLERVGQVRDRLNEYIKNNDEIRDVIGEKIFMIFYKVFPEAADADDVLKRIVKAHKKKPRG